MKQIFIKSVHLWNISLFIANLSQAGQQLCFHSSFWKNAVTRISNIIHGQILHLGFLEPTNEKECSFAPREVSPIPCDALKKSDENPKSWHKDVIKLSGFMERSIFQFPLNKWKTHMHSVKKYIMPKHVKYVSLNILQFNENAFFRTVYITFAGEKIKIFYFLHITVQKLPFFPSCKTPALGYLCMVN